METKTDRILRILFLVLAVLMLLSWGFLRYKMKTQIEPLTELEKKTVTDTSWSYVEGEPIDLNRADKETLMLLPDVGEATAEKIIAYRTEAGAFTYKEELMNISGIGEKTYEELKDLVTVIP